MKICEKLRVVRNIESTNSSKIANWKNSRNLLIFQFGKLKKLEIQKIRKICDLKNSENC